MYRQYPDEDIMSDTTGLLTNPVISAAVATGVTAVSAIIVAAINKRRAPEDVQLDVQKVVNESFKAILDGYEKQIATYRVEFEQQNITNERLHLQLEKNSELIEALTKQISDQETTISQYIQRVDDQADLIGELERKLQYFDCSTGDCIRSDR